MNEPQPLRVLVLTYTEFAREPRALKQAQRLRTNHSVTTAGPGATPLHNVEHVELPTPGQRWGVVGRILYLVLLTLRLHRLITWVSAGDAAVRARLGASDWDLVIAHDVRTVVVALTLRSRSGVLVDLHEYAPRQNEHSPLWNFLIAPYFRWLCRAKVPQATAAVTVSQSIADEYLSEYGINATLILNSSPYQALRPVPVSSPIRLVHSGVAAPQRHLEILIDAVLESTADVTLDLYLVEAGSDYGKNLRARARHDERIRFREPVPHSDLVHVLNEYDVGVHVLPPVNINHLWALPNKLFDYVQARLGVIIGPSPEMVRIVTAAHVGTVAAGFTSSDLRKVLDSLCAERVMDWKRASDRNAMALSAEKQLDKLEEVVQRISSKTS